MTRWLCCFWKWSWIPCLCGLGMCAYWLERALDHFVTFGIYHDSEPYAVRLVDTGRRELDHLVRRAGVWLASSSPLDVPEPLRLRAVQLMVARRDLERLDAELPYSGREFVPGMLQIGEEAREVRVRYRGDTLPHWGYAKKSFRIRTGKGAPFEGMRTFNLIAAKFPEQLNNYLGYRLAALLGLRTPRVELVNVFLNGSFHGLYELIEQPGGETLYAGELLKRDAWSGVPNQLFCSATLWDGEGLDPRDGPTPLADLITAINQPAEEASMQRLGELLDLEQFARLSVLEQLTQSHHLDHFHNWRLRWDPRRARFSPIVWDVTGWLESTRPRDGEMLELHPVFSPLHFRLHAHAGFLRARDRVLDEFYESGSDRVLLAELDHALAAVASPLAADPNLMPPDQTLVDDAMAEFAGCVRETLEGIQRAWFAGPELLQWRPPTAADEPVLLRIEAVRPVRGLELHFSRPVQPRTIALRVTRPEGPTELDLGGRWQVRDGVVILDLSLVSELESVFSWRPGTSPLCNSRRRVLATSYEVLLDGLDARELLAVREVASDRRFESSRDLVATLVRDLFALVD